MSSTALNSAARLTDALERELVRGNLGPRKPMKFKRAVRGLLGLVDRVNATTSRVRAQSARMGGAHW